MAGTAPISSFFRPKPHATRQSTKRKATEAQNEDERDWTPSKRVKAGKSQAAEGTPVSARKKVTNGSKQSKLAFGLQTPASSVATPEPSSSKSRKYLSRYETDTPRPRPATARDIAQPNLPTPQVTDRKGKAASVARAHTDDASEHSPGTRPASPIVISSSSLDHISPPPATRTKHPLRPLRPSGSIIELTSSEDEDVHSNPFLDRTTKPRAQSPNYELPDLSGPLSPLTQQSSIDSVPAQEPEFKVPELPSHMRDPPESHVYSQVVPSSQSQELFHSSSSRQSAASPMITTSPLLDTTDMRRALPSSDSSVVPSSQTQELPSFSASSSPSQLPPSSLPASSAPDHSSQQPVSPISHMQDVQPMLLSPLLNSPGSSRRAQISPRGTPHKLNSSSYSQVESSQLDELELRLPPSPSKGASVLTPTHENSPPGQRTSPVSLPGSSALSQRATPMSIKHSAVGEPSRLHVGASPSKMPATNPKALIDPLIGSLTQEEIPTPARSQQSYTDSPTQAETPIRSPARVTRPAVDDSPTQEEFTQSTPYKRRHPRADLVSTKRSSPLKPREQFIVEESDSDAETHGPLPALRLGASRSNSEVQDETDVNQARPSSRPAPARVGNASSFVYTGSGKRSRESSQKDKLASQSRSSHIAGRQAQQDPDSQDAFFNPPPALPSHNTQSSSEFGSFVGSIDSDIAEYVAMDIDPPSFDLHTQDLLPVKSVLDRRYDN